MTMVVVEVTFKDTKKKKFFYSFPLHKKNVEKISTKICIEEQKWSLKKSAKTKFCINMTTVKFER